MRFIGNKEPIVNEIKNILDKEGLINKNKKLKLFDAFCGTGAVSNYLKNSFDLIINDSLNWCVVYSRGRIVANKCTFEKLGFDPFDFFNSNKSYKKGFFYKNYSPGGSNRMYFSADNAGRIDFFRDKIESWRGKQLIDENEYSYLLASLIESISFVSNTAGVYGAYLKHWDSRSKKPIVFQKVESWNKQFSNLKCCNQKIEEIIDKIECDVLYLDPPYTQNQYGTQYHLLETLVLSDSPEISKITGSRPTNPMRSDWSKMYKAHILLDKIISKTKAKYILLSYSPDGFMSKSFIEASLKRYGKINTYKFRKISYNKYTNFKSRQRNEHFEYLYFIEKKDFPDIHYESPLNFIGSKAGMISEISKYLPEDIQTFVDIFGGGFNVGINSHAERIIYNDINYFVKDLVESFKIVDTYSYVLYIKSIIRRYNLEVANASSYLRARKDYNSLPITKRSPMFLYTVILYGFNQQIRFNGDHDFNNPVGMRWFNDKVLEKMISFARVIKEKNITFESMDFRELLDRIPENAFVYMDPPYRHTTGAYNDGRRGFNGWAINDEEELLGFADCLNERSIRFMLSYVIEHKSNLNIELIKWVNSNKYRLIKANKVPGINRKEVLILNYT